MASEKQIIANQQNSTNSTGPKDTNNTRFNAVKHGLCSKKFRSEEDKKEFNEILQEILEELEPKSKIQLRIIERIAMSLWENQKIIEAEQEKNYSAMCNLGYKLTESYEFADLFQRYKQENENKFYKGLKMLHLCKIDWKF